MKDDFKFQPPYTKRDNVATSGPKHEQVGAACGKILWGGRNLPIYWCSSCVQLNV